MSKANAVTVRSAMTMFSAVVSTPRPRSMNNVTMRTVAILSTEENAILSTGRILRGNNIKVIANPGMNSVSAKPNIILNIETNIFYHSHI